MTSPHTGIDYWIELLSDREIPVMRQTARALEDARAAPDLVSVRKLTAIVLHDPLMTARVLRFMTRRRSKRQLQEISTIEHAVMMLGVEPFFHHFAQFDVIEDELKAHPQALLGLLHLIRHAKRAARYASDWAIWRHDLNSEEVTVAATLHDFAEMLMWCFAPQQMLALRDAQAQKQMLGFPLLELQDALCAHWQFPDLLSHLRDKTHHDRPRTKNVRLAVDLVRHSTQGWDNPALQDDFQAIARLMNIDQDTLMLRLGIEAPTQDKPA